MFHIQNRVMRPKAAIVEKTKKIIIRSWRLGETAWKHQNDGPVNRNSLRNSYRDIGSLHHRNIASSRSNDITLAWRDCDATTTDRCLRQCWPHRSSINDKMTSYAVDRRLNNGLTTVCWRLGMHINIGNRDAM